MNTIARDPLNPTGFEIPDPPEEFGQDGGKFYRAYDALAGEIDEDLTTSLKEQLDGMLIFTGLFAGVNTAFLALTIPLLSADPSDDTNALLNSILMQMVAERNSTVPGNSELPSAGFSPSGNIFAINALFGLSLAFAIISSFLAVLGRQWLVYYRKRSGGGPDRQRWEQLKRLPGAQRWRMELILDDVLPALLQTGLIVFCISLIMYLHHLSPAISIIVGIPLYFGLAIFVVSALCTLWDRFCPFHSPLSHLLCWSAQNIPPMVGRANRAVPFCIGVLRRLRTQFIKRRTRGRRTRFSWASGEIIVQPSMMFDQPQIVFVQPPMSIDAVSEIGRSGPQGVVVLPPRDPTTRSSWSSPVVGESIYEFPTSIDTVPEMGRSGPQALVPRPPRDRSTRFSWASGEIDDQPPIIIGQPPIIHQPPIIIQPPIIHQPSIIYQPPMSIDAVPEMGRSWPLALVPLPPIKRWLQTLKQGRQEETLESLQVIALRRAICTSDDPTTLLHATANIIGITNKAQLEQLWSDTAFQERLFNQLRDSRTRRLQLRSTRLGDTAASISRIYCATIAHIMLTLDFEWEEKPDIAREIEESRHEAVMVPGKELSNAPSPLIQTSLVFAIFQLFSKFPYYFMVDHPSPEAARDFCNHFAMYSDTLERNEWRLLCLIAWVASNLSVIYELSTSSIGSLQLSYKGDIEHGVKSLLRAFDVLIQPKSRELADCDRILNNIVKCLTHHIMLVDTPQSKLNLYHTFALLEGCERILDSPQLPEEARHLRGIRYGISTFWQQKCAARSYTSECLLFPLERYISEIRTFHQGESRHHERLDILRLLAPSTQQLLSCPYTTGDFQAWQNRLVLVRTFDNFLQEVDQTARQIQNNVRRVRDPDERWCHWEEQTILIRNTYGLPSNLPGSEWQPLMTTMVTPNVPSVGRIEIEEILSATGSDGS